MKITVLGSGGWGTALALLLLDNGNDVTLWSFMEEECRALREKRENPMLKGVPLPEALHLTSSMDALGESELVVMATPSFAVRTTARKAAPLLRQDAVVVSVAKGIEKDTALCLTQVIEEELGGKGRVVALSGPSHADVMGVELGAALKNVLALCCGISDGMGLGDNTKALLMTRGMTEMARLGVALGGRKETFAGLSGMGDLIVTCTSMHSRNRRCGILIGQGKDVQTAMAEVGATVEGYYAALSAHQLSAKAGVEMPICQRAYRVLYEGQPVQEVVSQLMTRSKRHEVDESWI